MCFMVLSDLTLRRSLPVSFSFLAVTDISELNETVSGFADIQSTAIDYN